jgi:hypothetical protein
MSNLKMRIAVALALTVFFASVAPIRATDYNPGVSTGQWIKYDGIQAVGAFAISDANNTDWMKMEVTQVSGKNVTLHMTAQYTNGTAADEMGLNVNVETGWSNESDTNGNFFLIAGNLQEGDTLPGLDIGFGPMKVNKTETRTYLSTSRTVNIVNTTIYEAGVMDYRSLQIYDQTSGMLLEINVSMVNTMMPTANMAFAFSTTETSFFGTSEGGGNGWLQDNILYIAAIVIVIIVVIAAVAVLMQKKKPPTTEPTTKSSTTKTE